MTCSPCSSEYIRRKAAEARVQREQPRVDAPSVGFDALAYVESERRKRLESKHTPQRKTLQPNTK